MKYFSDSITLYWSWPASYSPELRWFVSRSRSVGTPSYTSDYSIWKEDRSLVTVFTAGVAKPTTNGKENLRVSEAPNSLTLHLLCLQVPNFMISLLDPLGRPIRSWQLAASDGPREITLNVADVPSGVYFVRLQGGGVDEVKRVAIIH
jgi:hypothetical protein